MVTRKIEWESVGYIHAAQDMAQWQALVNTVKYLRVP